MQFDENNDHLEELLSAGTVVHLVGAKGTGMAALAELLTARGCRLSGSDVGETFYTDEILGSLGVTMHVGFDPSHVPEDAQLVIFSAAYDPSVNAELVHARGREIPVVPYPVVLGLLSRTMDSTAISGVHGKTTTTAITGTILKALDLEATILAGSAVAAFGGRSTISSGNRYFVAETCEYRRHFLSFRPRRMVLTSIESDHQDYYPTYEDILGAFLEFGRLLPEKGLYIYCADDPGASEAASRLSISRPDIQMLPYGFTASGDWQITGYEVMNGYARFSLAAFSESLEIRVPGRHVALDAIAAVIVAAALIAENVISKTSYMPGYVPALPSAPVPELQKVISRALSSFTGSRRRSEIVGEVGDILIMDDYGHHPTAIEATIRGIREFWPTRRIVVDFMSHTVSRTKALFLEFSRCMDMADEVILHRIYPSAREDSSGGPSGQQLYAEVAKGRDNVRYFEYPMDAFEYLLGSLKSGDLLLTMGAGDNWKLGLAVLNRLKDYDNRQEGSS